jgi:transcriptional regulator with XRE-family HTH domain
MNTQMNRIKDVLDQKGRLAEQLGKSFNMVKPTPNRHQPPMEVLYKIAEILDVEAADLLVAKKDLKK